MTREMLQSLYLHLEMVAVAWSEWIMGGLLVVLYKLYPLLSNIYNQPIPITSGPGGSAMSSNKEVSTPARLV